LYRPKPSGRAIVQFSPVVTNPISLIIPTIPTLAHASQV
jgi:hypothetical protein